MRGSYERQGTSILTWLLSAIAAAFVVQSVFARYFSIGLDWGLGLGTVGIREGHIWTLLTYGFLHSTDNLLQIIAYMLVIYFAGRQVLPILGARRFIALYASALALGGAFWLAVHWGHPDILVGASAAASALVILYACFYPNQERTYLLFFVPVTVKPKHIALALLAVDLCGAVFYEVLGAPSPFHAAHSAHLGGMAAAWIYYRYIHESSLGLAPAGAEIELPRWMRQRGAPRAAAPSPAYSVNIGDRGSLRAEVDRILDKINSDGFASLSADEKRVLDEARDLISRR